jgi:hypothetical protein
MMISGKPRSGMQFGGGSLQGTGIGLVIFLGALGLAVSLIARSRTPEVENEAGNNVTGPEDTETGLLDAIVALDDLYKEGRLPADAYEERRARLKERLRKLKGL